MCNGLARNGANNNIGHKALCPILKDKDKVIAARVEGEQGEESVESLKQRLAAAEPKIQELGKRDAPDLN